ncbi:hypothetical protein SLA2020_000080 [Shorea laevis]
MVLNVVDLQCSKCYKKIKKLLCKFPEIRDQEYDEKANKVTIKVVCCSPEKIRDKLRCKGGRSIKNIVIREPEKPKPKEEKKAAPEKKPPEEKKDKKKVEDEKPSLPPLQVTLPLVWWVHMDIVGDPFATVGVGVATDAVASITVLMKIKFCAQSCKHVIACFIIFNLLDRIPYV